ncbi:MAG: hypothetical protein GEU98_20575 [Pseudonocardiaceae bacterium]|nr:hypothetical protein [Pseudonocardiaceae bacterium]
MFRVRYGFGWRQPRRGVRAIDSRQDRERRLPIYDVDETDRLPAYVYLPSPPIAEEASEFLVELRELPDGRNALLVYSSVEKLLAAYGDDQTWIRLDAQDLAHVRAYSELDVVLLDSTLPQTEDGVPVEEEIDPDQRLGTGMVCVPCRDHAHSPDRIEVELAEVDGGQHSLLVYTSKQLLVACCGPNQPWFEFPIARLPELRRECGVELMYTNVPVPEKHRRADDEE